MMDPAAAASLRALFAAKAGDYPYLAHEAEILFETQARTKCTFKTATPAETANMLQHIVNNEESGVFNRTSTVWSIPAPLYFRMYKIVRLAADNKQACLLAFNFTFRESGQPSSVWLSNPAMTDYYWQGDERVENKPPFTTLGPTLHETITILRKAGKDWGAVNFMSQPQVRPTLTLVHSRP